MILTPTITENPLKSCFACGDQKTIKSVLESLIFNLLLIIHTLISEIQLFNLIKDSKGVLHLKRYIELSVISIYVIVNTVISHNSTQR